MVSDFRNKKLNILLSPEDNLSGTFNNILSEMQNVSFYACDKTYNILIIFTDKKIEFIYIDDDKIKHCVVPYKTIQRWSYELNEYPRKVNTQDMFLEIYSNDLHLSFTTKNKDQLVNIVSCLEQYVL